MRSSFAQLFALAVLLAMAGGGCATQTHFPSQTILPDDGSHHDAVQRAQQTVAHLFPARYCATQRAIITVGGKQFTCDGLLTVSPANGYHLALASTFGTVTDLRVKPDGDTELLKVTPLFRADWSRRFVARDLRRLFIPPGELRFVGRLADGQLVLRTTPDSAGVTAEYIFSADGSRWQELELAQNGKIFYHMVVKHYLKFPATAVEIPNEFDVTAKSYRLELRIAAISVPPATAERQP